METNKYFSKRVSRRKKVSTTVGLISSARHEVKRHFTSDFFQSTRIDQNSSTKFSEIEGAKLNHMVQGTEL